MIAVDPEQLHVCAGMARAIDQATICAAAGLLSFASSDEIGVIAATLDGVSAISENTGSVELISALSSTKLADASVFRRGT